MPVTPANRFITRARDADDAATAFGVSRTLFVDPTSHSSSSAARGRSDLSYQTYAQALAAWQPGDRIVLRPGLYATAMQMPSYTRSIVGGTGLSRAGNVVTATLTATHAIPVGCRILVSGATSSTFDGVFQVATVPSATTLTYKQYGSDASSGGGTLTAVGYIHLDDGAVVDVTHLSIANTVATLGASAKTFTIVTGGGEFYGRSGYCISMADQTDSRLEIACRSIAGTNADGAVGIYAGGARSIIVADVADCIMSERYDAIWMFGSARCRIRARVIEGGEDAVELGTTQGCHIEAEEIASYFDRWQGVGSGTPTSSVTVYDLAAGQTHYIKANLVQTVGSVDNLGFISAVKIQATSAGRVIYDVRRTVCHGGATISASAAVTLVNGQYVSTYTGTGDAESGQSGYAIFTEGSPILRFMGECHLVASSAVTTSTFTFEPTSIPGPCRYNKAPHADLTLPDGVLDTEIS